MQIQKYRYMNNLLKLCFLLLGVSIYSQKANRIEGNYIGTIQNDCTEKIIINIYPKKKQLYYLISINKQKGKVHFTKDENYTYIHLDKLEGVYSNDSITFQNYGNSLNNYLRFKECGSKYLVFVKNTK